MCCYGSKRGKCFFLVELKVVEKKKMRVKIWILDLVIWWLLVFLRSDGLVDRF